MPILPTALASVGLAGATGGASIPFEVLAGVLGLGTLSGLFGSGESPQDEAVKYMMEQLKNNLSHIKSTSFTKGEVDAKTDSMKRTAGGAANVAAGQIGATIPETIGSPSGQAFQEYYTQALAPVIAQGERDKVGIDQFGMEFFANLDNAAKSRLVSALAMGNQIAQGQPDMDGWQKFFTSFMQGANLGATGFGNLAQGWASLTKKPLITG